MNKEEIFNSQFEKIFSDVPDCVLGVDSYQNIIKRIFELTNGLLKLNGFEGIIENDREYKLILKINNKSYTYQIRGGGYFFQDLLMEFNKIIRQENLNEKRELVDFNGNGHNYAIVFIDSQKQYELAKKGDIWKSEDWIYEYEKEKDNIKETETVKINNSESTTQNKTTYWSRIKSLFK